MTRTACLGVLLLVTAASAQDPAAGPQLPDGATMRFGSTRFRHPGKYISAVQFSPDGTSVVTVGDGPAAVFWDAKTGTEQRGITVEGLTPRVLTAAVWSPDGKAFALGAFGGVLLYETSGWKVANRFVIDGRAAEVAFSADGKTLTVLDARHTRPDAICRFDVATGRELTRATHDRVTGAKLSPDGRYILTGENYATVLDTATGEPVTRYRAEEKAPKPKAGAPDATYSPLTLGGFPADGSFAVVHYRGRFTLWDVEKDVPRHVFAGPFVPTTAARALAVSPDGKRIAAVGFTAGTAANQRDAAFVVLDAEKGVSVVTERIDPPGGNARIGAEFSRDSKWVAVHVGSGVTVRDAATGKAIDAGGDGPTGETTVAQFGKDGTAFLTLTPDERVVRLWDAKTGKFKKSLPVRTPCAAFSHDGKLIATGGADGDVKRGRTGNVVQLWSAAGEPVATLPEFHQSPVAFVAFAAGDRHLISTDTAGITVTWSVESRTKLGDIPGGGQTVLAVADDGVNALVNARGTLAFQNVQTGAASKFKTPPGVLGRPVMSRDGRLLAGYNAERQLTQVWNPRDGSWVLPLLPARLGPSVFALSDDGKTLATGELSGEWIRLWDLPTGKLRGGIRTTQPGFAHLAFTPDGRQILGCGLDGSLLVWTTDKLKEPTAPKPGPKPKAGSQNTRWYALTDNFARNPPPVVAFWEFVDDGDETIKFFRTVVKPAGTPNAPQPPSELRLGLVMDIVELIGTEDARKYLAELAAGTETAAVTKAAKAVLARIEARK